MLSSILLESWLGAESCSAKTQDPEVHWEPEQPHGFWASTFRMCFCPTNEF